MERTGLTGPAAELLRAVWLLESGTDLVLTEDAYATVLTDKSLEVAPKEWRDATLAIQVAEKVSAVVARSTYICPSVPAIPGLQCAVTIWAPQEKGACEAWAVRIGQEVCIVTEHKGKVIIAKDLIEAMRARALS